MNRIEKYWKTFIKRKLNFFVLSVNKDVCFMIFAVTAWSMKIVVGDFLHDSIIWRTFLIIQIISVISNSVNQYLFSIANSCLFKNIIDWIFFRSNEFFSSRLFFTWNIIVSNFHCLDAFTSINKSLYMTKWIKNLNWLKMCCRCSYAIYSKSMNSNKIVRFE